tara:strand:+ start:764 stop:973 length:210 start_codon:yes stop_codon:yes gene_type:complete
MSDVRNHAVEILARQSALELENSFRKWTVEDEIRTNEEAKLFFNCLLSELKEFSKKANVEVIKNLDGGA